MDTELVGFLGVIIGALVSFLATLMASRIQNEMAFKNIRISILQNKISKVEIVLDKIFSVKIDLNADAGNVSPRHIIGAAFGAFSEKVAFSQQCHHYLPKELTSEVNMTSVEVNESFCQGVARKDIDMKIANELFAKVQKIESELLNQIHSKLTDWQLELDAELNL